MLQDPRDVHAVSSSVADPYAPHWYSPYQYYAHCCSPYQYSPCQTSPGQHSCPQTATVHLSRPFTSRADSGTNRSVAYNIVSGLFLTAFTVTFCVFLGLAHGEDSKGACGKQLWPLILVRLIFNVLEWVLLFILDVTVPRPGMLQKIMTLLKLAFAISFTVILTAAVSGGCAQVSSNWYASVVVSYIFMVVDWISAVAGIVYVLAATNLTYD